MAAESPGKKARDDGMVASILRDVQIPKMCRLVQRFDPSRIEDIEAAVRREFEKAGTLDRIMPGMEVAITAGSRGITDMARILRETASAVKSRGGKPFLVPAMGSHGGCTAEGQAAVLAGYGITEETIGCPVKSSLETVQIAATGSGLPVNIDKYASRADGIIVVNRVKYHTAFRGTYESGLMKMIVIGLGKQKGAELCHSLGLRAMSKTVEEIARCSLQAMPFLFGLAVVENAYDKTRSIKAIPAERIPDEEPALLAEAKKLMPSLPFRNIDVLIVDEIGKDISGGGMDPNITGTFVDPDISASLKAGRTVVLDLTEETKGNATGLGRADFTTQRAFDKFDFESTYPNILTPAIVPPGKIPIVLANDRLAVKAAIKTCGIMNETGPRIVRIKNSLKIEEIFISDNLVLEARQNPEVLSIAEKEDMLFDTKGNLLPD